MATNSAKTRSKYSSAEVKELGHQLITSKAHLNNAPILLSLLSNPSSPLGHALEALISLQSFFTPLISRISLSSARISADVPLPGTAGKEEQFAEAVYKKWLKSTFNDFVSVLIDLSISPHTEQSLRVVSVDAIMELARQGKGGAFRSDIYFRFLRAIVQSTSSIDFVVQLLVTKFFKSMDVCYFSFIGLDKLARNYEPAKSDADKMGMIWQDDPQNINGSGSEGVFIFNIHNILSRIPSLEDQVENEMWSQSEPNHSLRSLIPEDTSKKSGISVDEGFSTCSIAKRIKSKMSKAWLSFLRLRLPLDLYKKVLSTLHQDVIPHLANPILLCDFLTRSYEVGGVISVMALNGLFILMTQHGLEYPDFYKKLYALLAPSIFRAKHRSHFFQLLDSCLKSPLLPAYLTAAFAKKLSRLALSAPPSGALVIIALIHNLLRRHPSINCLVHRTVYDELDTSQRDIDNEARGSKTGVDSYIGESGVDHFRIEETDPVKANAMRSSLWEVETLRRHYCPAVSRFVLSLENDLTVRAKTSEVAINDFSSGSYGTIFNDAVGRRIKQVPLAFYKMRPTSLFPEADFPGWKFEHGQDELEIRPNNGNDLFEGDGEKSSKKQRLG
ncbi:nucleolar complex protein 4 homolog B isoform X1 [Amborella trichopoda]|uniref:CCAAT-binding factor domain-containing protein n=1 Tax=Amborella trichopoda TaxID=13333 RepID=U5D9W0_AMBTC|nr:nucleolar complex protein 4 homolog B isoform X1 [Amborella trichopoda]ERN17168.1 hypothetical protein AMTR_s00044p00141100 [Amborella trichopoda]|eukprot:XP_006855701.1 nucleolar complex protein 4 homolog B isoform X1 [Amborella trichopoda]